MTEHVRSEAEMAALSIGPPEELDGPVVLVDYDAQWPQMYRTEAARISEALGTLEVQVAHVGSTSVEGLVAKPRIDIVLTVPDSGDEAIYVPPMQAAGYVLRLREPDWHRHRVFTRRDAEVNVHTFTAGCLEVQRMLAFRDHLRRDSADRSLYDQTKRSLASRRWKYTQHYADAKSDVVEGILLRTGIGPLSPDACPCAR